MRNTLTLLALVPMAAAVAQNQAPQISNVQWDVPWGSHQLTLTYDLTDAEGDASTVHLLISDDGGTSHVVNVGTKTGHVGAGITPGTGRQIVWDFDTITDIYAYSLRLVADDGQVPTVQEIVDQIDSVNLLSDLQQVAGIRHYQTDPTHLQEVRDLISQRFAQAGLQVRNQEFPRAGVTGINIIGRKPGLADERPTYIMDAHYDGVSNTAGADDNGSGVVSFLEAMRVLAPYNFARSIDFIGFDFEESISNTGLYGSQKFVEEGRMPYETIEGVINFETMGYYSDVPNSQSVPTGFGALFPTQVAALEADEYRGNFIVNAGDTESADLAQAFADAATAYVPELKVTTLVVPLNGAIAPDLMRSDHAHFWLADVPALMLTDGANLRNPNYHTPNDTIGSLNFTFMSRVVKAATATLIEWAGLQNSTYVDVEILNSAVPMATGGCALNLWPNPSGGVFHVQSGGCFGPKATANIYGLDGREVSSRTATTDGNRLTFDFQGLACGTYFLRVHEGALAAVRKVVIR